MLITAAGFAAPLVRLGASALVIAAALLLAGCEGKVTADLAVEAPVDRNIGQVIVYVSGLEFRTDGGATRRLSFTDSQQIDLMDYLTGTPLRLFTNEELADGDYSGVRLTFDADAADDAQVINTSGDGFPLLMAEGDYAGIDISIDDDSSSDAFTLTLDMRQSLRFDDDEDEYTLIPYLRSTPSDNAGQMTGTVNVSCPVSSPLATNGAVYLFQGESIVPDDRDSVGVEPYATAAVNTSGSLSSYTLRLLPEGRYTIAVTCLGHQDDPESDDELNFKSIGNVRLGRGEQRVVDLTG